MSDTSEDSDTETQDVLKDLKSNNSLLMDDSSEEEIDDKIEDIEPVVKKRGRPASKNPKPGKVPTGKPRGRPPSGNPRPVYVPTGNPRGRRPGWTKKVDNRGAHFRKPDHLKVGKKPYIPTGRPRGRPSEGKGSHVYFPTGKPRGRPKKIEETDE